MTEAALSQLIESGIAAYERGEYAREVDIWKAVAARDPQNPHWHANLAQAFANVGRVEQAEILFQYAMSFSPPPSAALNNYVAMLARLGGSTSQMLPLLVLALERSETYQHFERHLLNVAAAIALGDRPASEGVWLAVRENCLAILDRAHDKTSAHEEFVDDVVRMFARYQPFKVSLERQDWAAASGTLSTLEQEFAQWRLGQNEVARIRHFRPLLSGSVALFEALQKLGSDAEYPPPDFHGEVSSAYEQLQAVEKAAGMFGSRTFLDIVGWSLAELHRQSAWLVEPSSEYDTEAHATPSSHLLDLSRSGYSELGEMLHALLAVFNRTIRRASQRRGSARSPSERRGIHEEAWRAIRISVHGIVGEYRGLSEVLAREMLGWNAPPRDRLSRDVERFKSFVEARTYPDFYIQGKPQEQIGRAVLLAFLRDRGFSEVPMRGGRVDVLVVHREVTFVVELKVWRGPQYHEDGIAELQEYVANGAVPDLGGMTYIVLDATESGKAVEYVEGNKRPENVDVVVVRINPSTPSRKGRESRRKSL
jgi:tetratricopeptide (TPR) repeat protein